MATSHYVQSPLQWGWSEFKQEREDVGSAARSVPGEAGRSMTAPVVRRITPADVAAALAAGVDDFVACRTDVIMLCLIYPVLGLLLASLALGDAMVPLVFPLVSGFALLGPAAAVGLYAMSRQREAGRDASWADAFHVLQAPAAGAIAVLALVLLGLFLAWMGAAYGIYAATLGPAPAASASAFFAAVFGTPAGWAMIAAGIGVGFLFAVAVLAISAVSFPLLLDREVGVWTAVATSVRAVAANPGPIALWGLVVTGGLALGAVPLLLGLAIVVPVLGHATWHLYRRLVAP